MVLGAITGSTVRRSTRHERLDSILRTRAGSAMGDCSFVNSLSPSLHRKARRKTSEVDCPSTLALEFSAKANELGSKHVRINDHDRPIIYKPISFSTPDLTDVEYLQNARHMHPNLQHSTKVCKSTVDVSAYISKKNQLHATASIPSAWTDADNSRPRGKSFPLTNLRLRRNKAIELKWFDFLTKLHLRHSAPKEGHSHSKRGNHRAASPDDSRVLVAKYSNAKDSNAKDSNASFDENAPMKARSHEDVNDRMFFTRHVNYVSKHRNSSSAVKLASKLILVNVASVSF